MSLHRQLPLGIKLEEALGWIGTVARGDGKQEAAELAFKLGSNIGATEITVHVDAAHILCQACDELRSRGENEAVAELEKIIRAMKDAPRIVQGNLILHPGTPGEVEKQLDAARTALTR